jgi:hypothetical protein
MGRAAQESVLTRTVTEHLALALGWSFVEPTADTVSCGLLRKIPAELACRLRCVPLVCNAHRIVVVVDDPFHGAYIVANSYLLGAPYGRPLEVALATPAALDVLLHKRVSTVRG